MANFAHDLSAMREAVTERTRIVFVASPNNPTGGANSEGEILELAEGLPDHVILCFDEAYAEYLEAAPDLRRCIESGRKVVCLRTFSKIYGLGGLRLGYAYGDPELIALLHRVRQPFNANSVGQAAALAALGDEAFVSMCREQNESGRKRLCEGLSALGFEPFGGRANFVLCRSGMGALSLSSCRHAASLSDPCRPMGCPNMCGSRSVRRRKTSGFLSVMEEIAVRSK